MPLRSRHSRTARFRSSGGAQGPVEAPFPRLGFSPVSHAKRISRFARNREVLTFSGHDATGLTRPYRDLLLAKNVYSISKIPHFAQGGILKNFSSISSRSSQPSHSSLSSLSSLSSKTSLSSASSHSSPSSLSSQSSRSSLSSLSSLSSKTSPSSPSSTLVSSLALRSRALVRRSPASTPQSLRSASAGAPIGRRSYAL